MGCFFVAFLGAPRILRERDVWDETPPVGGVGGVGCFFCGVFRGTSHHVRVGCVCLWDKVPPVGGVGVRKGQREKRRGEGGRERKRERERVRSLDKVRSSLFFSGFVSFRVAFICLLACFQLLSHLMCVATAYFGSWWDWGSASARDRGHRPARRRRRDEVSSGLPPASTTRR